jgi:SAM-dependent methyltransferase
MLSVADEALGGNVHNGDPFSYAPSLWTYLVRRFSIRSVLDVGCGQGHAAAYFASVLGCLALGIDGLTENLTDAVYPIAIHDLRSGPFKTRVDLVYCVEVVEHVDELFVENLLQTLVNGKVIAMTHAVPGQTGHHHVNCRDAGYWQDHLERHGYRMIVEDTHRARELASQDKAQYFQNTGMIFGRL